MDVGFIGLGLMGAPMAATLLRGGHTVRVWNRTPEKAQPLAAQGAQVSASPAEAAQAGVIVTMLADEEALDDVLKGPDGALAGLGAGGLHISMSTIGAGLADRLQAAHSQMGAHYLAAPVLGRPNTAEDGKLFILAGGAASDIDRARPLFEAMGQRTFAVGERPSAANVVKLCVNFMILSAIEAMGEAMTLADKTGVERAMLLEVITETLFGSPVYRGNGAIIVEGRYRPAGFAAPLGLKDMRLTAAKAEAALVPMPLLGLLRDRLISTIAQEGDDIDWTGVAHNAARSAGI